MVGPRQPIQGQYPEEGTPFGLDSRMATKLRSGDLPDAFGPYTICYNASSVLIRLDPGGLHPDSCAFDSRRKNAAVSSALRLSGK